MHAYTVNFSQIQIFTRTPNGSSQSNLKKKTSKSKLNGHSPNAILGTTSSSKERATTQNPAPMKSMSQPIKRSGLNPSGLSHDFGSLPISQTLTKTRDFAGISYSSMVTS
ncbi:hypothetical protein Nepgr_003066 [Nepenthes gracilis]|uniref:Uncharacterized protein n=1 Tax=Nepenthes gracilis TaxID=150966 RepID=A0AAD3XCW4_NEPGR|nr:hypothetical protein Nepgr_003066 [Nepenthes gracilis]